MSARMFPIMSTDHEWRTIPQPIRLTQIPWAAIAPHEAQAQKNHGQTLERLAERGGLDAWEALAVIKGRDLFPLPADKDALKIQQELSALCLDSVLREALEQGRKDATAVREATR